MTPTQYKEAFTAMIQEVVEMLSMLNDERIRTM